KMSSKDNKTVPGMFVDREIQSCHDAMEVIDGERMKIEKIVVAGLQEPNVRCPILCWEANRLIFTNGKYNIFPPDINYNTEYSEGPFDGVYMAERTKDGGFENPQRINSDFQIAYPFIPVTATADGSELYLIVDRGDNGDIYVSKFEDGKYQPAKREKKLNSRKWESHATITADGKRIYFTSHRRGGVGGLDIWYSDRDEDGKWQKPVNAGTEINTPFHEEMPYVIRNGNALYFSSESHTNVGGFDVFYTSRDDQNQKWTTPVNLGYPFSTAGNDMGYILENTPVFAFCPINDNKRREGVGECDCISLIDEEAPQLASISGIIELGLKDQEALMQIRVKVVEQNTGKEIANVPVDKNGNYLIDGIVMGHYEVIAYDDNGDFVSRSIEIPQNDEWNITGVNMKIDNTVIAEVDEVDELIIKPVLFDFDKFNIEPEFEANLNLMAEYLVKNPEAKFRLSGHTDHYGSVNYNMLLSQNRVVQVKNYLVAKGVKENQLELRSFGKKENITIATANDDIRRLNRRVTVLVIEQGKTLVKVAPIVVPEEYKVK
ncbi:MAG: OmpA family protein, partial [Bacteroidales bacterium]|nr:OmpA family protein [Bacteroidales bacterium]